MGRTPCCDKASVKRGSWSAEEDAKLKAYIERHGTAGNWIALPRKIGLRRCGKSCRLRWLNYLRPNLKRGEFSKEEDSIICRLYCAIGSRWSVIAAQLPGRTDNDIKNHWNTRLKKELFASNQQLLQQQQQRQKARQWDIKTAKINGDPASLGGQPLPSYGGRPSSSLIFPASAVAVANPHEETSRLSTELDEIFRFGESVKLEAAGMSVNWNETTTMKTLVCSDLVDQGSQGILLQQQFMELARHLDVRF